MHRFALERIAAPQIRRRAAIIALTGKLFAREAMPDGIFEIDFVPGVDHFHSDNGSGDYYHIYLYGDSLLACGFAHESNFIVADESRFNVKTWPGTFDGMPSTFESALQKSGFDRSRATAGFWRDSDSAAWRNGIRPYPESEDDSDPDLCRSLFADFLASESRVLDWIVRLYGGFRKENEPVLKSLERRDFRRAFGRRRDSNVDALISIIDSTSADV